MSRRIEVGLILLALAAVLLPLALGPQNHGLDSAWGWLGRCWQSLAGGEGWAAALLLAALIPGAWVLGRSLWATRKQARSTQGLWASLPLAPPPPELARMAEGLGLSHLSYADSPQVFAFAHAQRVTVSRGLVELLSPQELEAVLLHERQHLTRRTAERSLWVGALTQGLGFLPLAAWLKRTWWLGEELEADRAAARAGRETVASALLRLARYGSAPGGAGFGSGPLELRVRVLLGLPVRRTPWIRALYVTVVVLSVLLLLPPLLHLMPLELHLSTALPHQSGWSC